MFRSILLITLFPLCALADNVSISSPASLEYQCASEVCFSKATLIGGKSIPLRNLKKKMYLVLNLFVAALYVGEEAHGSEEVLADIPKKIAFFYLRGFTSETLIEHADEVLKKNPEIDLNPLRTRIDQLNLGYEGGVKKGDLYEIEYDPNRGSTLIRNGKEFVTVPGLDFARAYLGIWLSKYPMSEDLRDALIDIKDDE